MSSKNVKTVVGSAFFELGSLLTPRLHLMVEYTKGGTSGITGEHFERGYQISIRHDRIDQDGMVSVLIDGKGDPTSCIATAPRFSQTVLDTKVEQVLTGVYDQLICSLYAKATAMRPDYNWPERILPVFELIASDGFADGGEEYTDEELALHNAVVSVVNRKA